MAQRHLEGKPAQITFTSDFHELLVGDLRPESQLTVRYDPDRIVPAGPPYVMGDPRYPVFGHFSFADGEPETIVTLTSPAGIIMKRQSDPTGRGPLLQAEVKVPANADFVRVWFHFDPENAPRAIDNDQGKFYWFRFPFLDLHLLKAEVVKTKTGGEFSVQLEALPVVENVEVRYVIINREPPLKEQAKLQRGTTPRTDGRFLWASSNVRVDADAILRFKIYYTVASRAYKDDNSSRYYLTPWPKPRIVPEPPDELGKAAAAWK
ncbi:MAG TPA: DUF6209 family protein [Gemmataceae bacterium]|nr:DUF6209 family protein [Gemmataceae bacterium]